MKNINENEKMKLNEVVKVVKERLEECIAFQKRKVTQMYDSITAKNLMKHQVSKEKNLKNALSQPYFARIDFAAKGKGEEEVYIGKTTILDEDANVIVADWRAPISSMYYDSGIGEASYNSPDGEIKGVLSLKRKYDIKDGKLLGYDDIEVVASDEVLNNCLSENADTRLKNIISTIQKEQNEIIRSSIYTPLIIQGVAGSGKTTVALHRIAYLIYQYAKKFNPEEFLIIAPNKFFLDYISTVLPDLGVDEVRQETFEEFATKLIGENLLVKSSNEILADIINSKDNQNTKIHEEVSHFKSSNTFKSIIDEYIEKYMRSFLADDVMSEGYKIISIEKLLTIFNNSQNIISLYDRIDNVKEVLSKYIKDYYEQISVEIKSQTKELIKELEEKISSQEKLTSEKGKIFRNEEKLLKELKKGGKKLLNIHFKKYMKYTSAISFYRDIIKKEDFSHIISKEATNLIKSKISSKNCNKEIEHDDLTGLLYIKYLVFGLAENISLKYVVVDEAQDYGEFTFSVLLDILKSNSITILGDLAQGIYSYKGIKSWNYLNEKVLDDKAELLTLTKSYRTTIEIINEANKAIRKLKDLGIPLATSVIRHGETVGYVKASNFEEMMLSIKNRISQLRKRNFRIAIITKDLQDAQRVYSSLNENEDIILLTDNSNEFNGNIVILPSYLSKGLEFDSVILFDVSKEKYAMNELEIKLLYVSMTRAMHTLDIFYEKDLTELLS